MSLDTAKLMQQRAKIRRKGAALRLRCDLARAAHGPDAVDTAAAEERMRVYHDELRTSLEGQESSEGG